MANEKFTDLEKSVMSDIISDGFFYDDLNDNFVGYAGNDLGKQERGALASLVKKRRRHYRQRRRIYVRMAH